MGYTRKLAIRYAIATEMKLTVDQPYEQLLKKAQITWNNDRKKCAKASALIESRIRLIQESSTLTRRGYNYNKNPNDYNCDLKEAGRGVGRSRSRQRIKGKKEPKNYCRKESIESVDDCLSIQIRSRSQASELSEVIAEMNNLDLSQRESIENYSNEAQGTFNLGSEGGFSQNSFKKVDFYEDRVASNQIPEL